MCGAPSGVASRISSSSSRKPMSSISSASSSTATRSADRSSAPRSRWSRSRPGRADDDMRAALQRAALLHRVHAADAGHDAGAGRGIEPFEFLADLDGEFAGRGDDQAERLARPGRAVAFEQLAGDGEAEGDGLAGAGLGRDDQVAALGFVRDDRGLDWGQRVIAARSQRFRERGMNIGLLHGGSAYSQSARER